MSFAFAYKKKDQITYNLPSRTGFNAMLHDGDDRMKSAITYLPVIEASPTDSNT